MARSWPQEHASDRRLTPSDGVAFCRLAARLVREATGAEPECILVVDTANPRSQIRSKSVAEFEDEVTGLTLEDVERLWIRVETGLNPDIMLSSGKGITGVPQTHLEVTSENRTWTEGIFAQLVEAIEGGLTKEPDHAEVGLVEAEQPSAPNPPSASGGPTPTHSPREWWRNPLVITVGGGILATVVGGLILAAVL